MLTYDQLSDKQKEAIAACLNVEHRLATVTGEAGSGKTTIMKFVVQAALENGYRPVLCAPTGKAAKRISEATGYPAQTIHSLLEFTSPGDLDERGVPQLETFPRRNAQNKLDHDLVIIDEASMLTHELADDLIAAIPTGGRVLAFGDDNQLPPVEKDSETAKRPSRFANWLNKPNSVRLDKVYRTGEGSHILTNAQRILRGNIPSRGEDFGLHITDQPVDVLLSLIDDSFKTFDSQVITAQNTSWVGTHKLNAALQNVLMEQTPSFILQRWKGQPPVSVGIGDKIIFTRNHYGLVSRCDKKGVFNGETGFIIDINEEFRILTIDLGDRVVDVPEVIQVELNNRVALIEPHRDIYLAYALTTHKSQGSEFQHVIYIINKSMTMMLNRRNVYTGVTRAKKRVDLISDQRGMTIALSQMNPRVFDKRERAK